MKLTRLFIAASAVYVGFLALPGRALAAAKDAPGTGENTPLNLDEEVEKTTAATGGGSGGGSLVRTFVGLAVVIAVIYGLYWILRQVKASREESSSGAGLTSLATLPLGPNRSVHMVRAGHEVVVLGVTDHAVTPIRTYKEDEAVAAGLLHEDPAGVSGPMTLAEAEAALRATNNGDAPAEASTALAPTKPANVGEFVTRLVDEMRKRTRR